MIEKRKAYGRKAPSGPLTRSGQRMPYSYETIPTQDIPDIAANERVGNVAMLRPYHFITFTISQPEAVSTRTV